MSETTNLLLDRHRAQHQDAPSRYCIFCRDRHPALRELARDEAQADKENAE